MDRKEPKMTENGEIGTVQITCCDGTIIQFPDDDNEREYLGGLTARDVFVDPSRLPPECEKYVVFRPETAVVNSDG